MTTSPDAALSSFSPTPLSVPVDPPVPEHNAELVNRYGSTFSGHFGSNAMPPQTGGRRRTNRAKQNNMYTLYNTSSMNPMREIKQLKKQVMSLKTILVPQRGRKTRSARSKSKKSNPRHKKSKKAKRGSKRRGASRKRTNARQRGGSTVTYSTGGVLSASDLNMATPVPYSVYPAAEQAQSYARAI